MRSFLWNLPEEFCKDPRVAEGATGAYLERGRGSLQSYYSSATFLVLSRDPNLSRELPLKPRETDIRFSKRTMVGKNGIGVPLEQQKSPSPPPFPCGHWRSG